MTVQPALDGTIPQPTPAEDFETWVDRVRPAFETAAASGREFASWHIKVAEHLPDPPNPKAMWGQLLHRLHDEGLIEPASWTTTRDGSGVRTWRGTRAARRGRAA
ncbi:hypothetical protein [Streptomyces ardesiacus]|uniref:hypothetical protein n=1 Tax=Streptomyces ardesiacus TaxID=285564 RepID=UPI002FDBBEDB